jgi:hypothetical protein
MNQIEFISGVKVSVAEATVHSVTETLNAPAGRKPAEHFIQLSKWYNSLNEHDKEMVIKVIKQATDMTIFGFLCILDGVRTIENSQDNGTLKLYYQKGEEKIMLNDPDEDFLNDMW